MVYNEQKDYEMMLEQDYQKTLEEEIERNDRIVKNLEEQLAKALAYREATENALSIFKTLVMAQDVEV